MTNFTAEFFLRGETVARKSTRGVDSLLVLDGPPSGRTILIPADSLEQAAVRLQHEVGGVIEFMDCRAAVFTKAGKWVVW